jgi:hypothetical protein
MGTSFFHASIKYLCKCFAGRGIYLPRILADFVTNKIIIKINDEKIIGSQKKGVIADLL